MRLISAIIAGLIAASSYVLGFEHYYAGTIFVVAQLARLSFVLFAFLSIVMLLRSFEKETIWPWHWRVNRVRGFLGRTKHQGGERRRGVDRRIKHESRSPKNERRTSPGMDRRTYHMA